MKLEESIVNSLIDDLAKTFSISKDDTERTTPEWHLTEEQRLLSISPPLVYLVGLVLLENSVYDDSSSSSSSSSSSYSPAVASSLLFESEKHTQFRDYCQRYNQCILHHRNHRHRHHPRKTLPLVSRISPRMVPNLQQFQCIEKDIAEKHRVALLLEAIVAKEQEEEDEEQCKSKETNQPPPTKRSGKKKTNKNSGKTNKKKEANNTKNNVPSSLDTTTTTTETLQDVLQVQLHATTITTDDEGAGWISDRKKTTIASSSSQNDFRTGCRQRSFPPQQQHSINEQSLPSKDDHETDGSHRTAPQTYAAEFPSLPSHSGKDNDPSVIHHGSISDRENSRVEEAHLAENNDDDDDDGPSTVEVEALDAALPPAPTTATNSSSSSTTATTTTADPMAQDVFHRIQQLESALAESNRLLRNEQEKLREEQERHINSMQALQLKLYISETRLKTYQDALEDHIQSVAENVYQPTTSSPPRRSHPSRSNAKEEPLSSRPTTNESPLISRVLQQSNRLQEDTGETR